MALENDQVEDVLKTTGSFIAMSVYQGVIFLSLDIRNFIPQEIHKSKWLRLVGPKNSFKWSYFTPI